MAKFDAASRNALGPQPPARRTCASGNTSAMSLSFLAAMGLVLLVGGHKVAAGRR